MQLTVRLAAALLVLLGASAARADGTLTFRGAYYKEQSTRVRQPMVDANLDAGARGTIDAHFLVDEITSASTATGAAGEFTEFRYETGFGYTRELGRGRAGAQVRYSTEPDYTSTFLVAHGEVDLAAKNTVLRAALGRGGDRITNGVAVDQGAIGTPPRSEALDTTLVSLGVTQILTTQLTASLTYDFTLLDGYQANIYRVVFGGGTPVEERVPDRRLRHAVFAGVRGHACPTRTTVIAGYRVYVDDWGILAHTPELRLVQELGGGLEVRGRYRLHTQGAADFYQEVYTRDQTTDMSVYVTDDEKLSAHRTHTVGGQVLVPFSLFGVRSLWADARVDAMVERVWQDTAFGNAWVVQLALQVPVVY